MRKLSFFLAALTLLAAGFVLAQVTSAKLPSVPDRTKTLTVITTTDGATETVDMLVSPAERPVTQQLALRIEGTHDGRVYGTLVAQVDGKWVDVQLASFNTRAGR
jgi:hypothetical protein